MKKNLSKNHILVQNMNSEIMSCIFNKKANGYLSIYDIENDDELNKDDEEEELVKKLNLSFDHDPDGALLWIPPLYKKEFLNFVQIYFETQFKEESFNFDNGGVAETLFFHDFVEGYLVEMLDPECFSEIFPSLLEEFLKSKNITMGNGTSLNDVSYANGYHLSSSWKDLSNIEAVKSFLISKNY